MKRWKIAALVCVIATCATLLLAGCSSQEYTPKAKDQMVPSSALGESGTLRVGVNASHAPLAGRPEGEANGQIMGIDVDVAEYMADEMGLKVKIVDVGNDPEGALSAGKVDIVLGVDSSDTDGSYWKSEPYLTTGVALFGTVNETQVPEIGSNPKIAAQASTTTSWQVASLFGDSSVITQNDIKSIFQAMASGAARYAASDAVVGTYNANENKFDQKIVALLGEPTGYCVAVASNNTELQSAVATVVARLTNGGIMDVIESYWLGAPLNLSSLPVVKSGGTTTSSSSTSTTSSSASASSASAASANSSASSSAASASAASASADDSGAASDSAASASA